MGFTKADSALFRAWANYPIARQHLTEFLDTMRRALLDELRAALVGPDGPGQAAADFATRRDAERGVVSKRGNVYVGFQIPAVGPERLSVGVWGWGAELYFYLDVPVATETDTEQPAKAVENLLGHGFESTPGVSVWRQLELTPELLAEDDLQPKLLAFAKDSFAMLKQSGVFELDAPTAAPIRDEDIR
jgi:hypothetical protein